MFKHLQLEWTAAFGQAVGCTIQLEMDRGVTFYGSVNDYLNMGTPGNTILSL